MAPKAYTSFFTDIIACRMYSGAMYPLNMLTKKGIPQQRKMLEKRREKPTSMQCTQVNGKFCVEE
jgi:hypothetical protein